jgi:ADP-heptose:LPS heptosyltransferase
MMQSSIKLRPLPTAPRRILVGLLLPIGDTLLATPALAALRRRFAAAEITALVSASNAGILDGNPDIARRVWVPVRGTGSRARQFLSGVRALRADSYDVIVNLSAASSIVTRLGGRAPARAFLDVTPLWWLVGGTPSYRARHAVDHYFHALAPLIGALPTSPEERVPRLALSADERRAARETLRELGIAASGVRLTMHVGGDGFNGRKRWAPERFAAVAGALAARYDAQVLLIGGRADRALSEATAALIPHGAHVLAGTTPLKATAALIEASTLFIGNDSVPMHIAAAVGTPALGIFGPSNWEQFAPVGGPGYRSRVVHSDLRCSPCFHFVGNDPVWKVNPCFTYACLKAITPQQVLDTAVEMLDTTTER